MRKDTMGKRMMLAPEGVVIGVLFFDCDIP